MAGEKDIKIRNRSDKPDNVISNEHKIVSECEAMQSHLPVFMRSFFIYLKGNVLPRTRLAYLNDITFFCRYLTEKTAISDASEIHDITRQEFNRITAADVNEFIDYCRQYTVETEK